jgi:hypothetical protein
MVKVQERVTRAELKDFEMLESRDYRLPSQDAVDSLSSTKSQMKKRGYEFKMASLEEPFTVRITRVK